MKSVMEGDSVTLNPDLTEIQGINEILWRFGASGPVIAGTDGTKISYPYLTERFRDRLQLDHQTGSLTIKKTRTTDSGLYQLEIILNTGPSYMTFNVTVYDSPSVIDVEMKSVTEGDSVTLQTDVTDTLGDELIVWRFGDEGKLIAKCDMETKSSTLHNDTDGSFRDRLKLDDQTGSLNISDIRNTHSGLYTVKISSCSKQTSYKRFSVTISGEAATEGDTILFGTHVNDEQRIEPVVSPGAVAGIVALVVLLLVFSVAAVGVF